MRKLGEGGGRGEGSGRCVEESWKMDRKGKSGDIIRNNNTIC